jgi:membrane protein YdbS with pleckstrin-like domain
MDKIETQVRSRPDAFAQTLVEERNQKKKVTKSLLNNAGIIIGVFLIFAVIVIVTTDIRITSFEDVAALGLDFFLLLFCSYSMYINASDSGMRHGLQSQLYTDSLSRYDEKKRAIINDHKQNRLHEFCRYYVDEELKNARMSVLAVVGLGYKEYRRKWLGIDSETIEKDQTISKVQKEALIRANETKPVKLTPEMIMRRGRGNSRRAPLGMKPEVKKGINFGVKFASTLLISLVMSIIVLDMVAEPSWVIFASCMLKLISIVVNGFTGYKFGFENIVFDTVNYMDDQTDLMEQAIQYFDSHSIPDEDADEDISEVKKVSD